MKAWWFFKLNIKKMSKHSRLEVAQMMKETGLNNKD